jgi:hypothetical protein
MNDDDDDSCAVSIERNKGVHLAIGETR